MTFTEVPFWCLAAIVFVLWLAVRKHYRATVAVLLTGCLVFYGYHIWNLLPLLLAYCIVNWAVGCRISRARRPGRVLALGVTFNLGLLAYWKYTPLLLHTLADLGGATAPTAQTAQWVIPFGISFYAFTGIAYMVDVYRQNTPAETNFFRYTLSAVFFPHLVAGPILRPHEFLEKLQPGTMPTRTEEPLEALTLLARGLFKKMVLADRLALAIDPFFAHVGDATTQGAWSLPFVWLYAFQIYFDFSGYTDIARGVGLFFGFRWPDNFDLPYNATSIQDFWRRWHITLSRFLKDYLYIPLGGSRFAGWRTNLNLILTMLLGGLWHGACWSFMLWGGLHGLMLVINRMWSQSSLGRQLNNLTGLGATVWNGICLGLTFQCVCLAWCFFRLTVLSDSLACVRKWFVFDADKMLAGGGADLSLWLLLVIYGLYVLLSRRLPSRWLTGDLNGLGLGFRWGFAVALFLLALLLAPGVDAPPFIYFQF